jgi:hypothetical protein
MEEKKRSSKKRQHTLPVSTYVLKWLRNRHGYSAALEVSSPEAVFAYHSPEAIASHFEPNRPGFAIITVIGYYPNRAKLYNLHLCLERLFNHDMLSYVKAEVARQRPAKTAMERFLASCKITEEDLSIETAYKRWQRQGKAIWPGIKIS